MFRSLLFVGSAALLILARPTDCAGERQCLQVYQSTCSNFFNGVQTSSSVVSTNHLPPPAVVPWPSTFPNARNLTLVDALKEFADFERLLCLDNYCSYLLHSFLCIHYFPPCDPTSTKKSQMVLPCREVCEWAAQECLDDVYQQYNFSRPEHLNCSNFPARSDPCPTEPAGDFIVACPLSAVHFEFYLPFGNKKLTVPEPNDSLEVCVKLASTGSHNSLQSPVTVHVTFEDLSAKGGLDYYDFENCSLLEFGVGRVKGDRECCEIKIRDDCLAEGKEEFIIHAHAQYPHKCGVNGSTEGGRLSGDCGSGDFGRPTESSEGTRVKTGGTTSDTDSSERSRVKRGGNTTEQTEIILFGGSLNSSTGSVGVCIIDDDVCPIQPKYCPSTSCKQRSRAVEETFIRNNYTYAAHVELLEVRNFTKFVGIDVRIIDCWELRRNHCPDVGKNITIPTCPVCPRRTLTPGSEYLIAGVRQKYEGKRTSVLPNLKDKGLISTWKESYTSIERWIQAAKNMNTSLI